jgi:hypothetical protein
MIERQSELLDAITKTLRYCKVQAGEKVVIYSDTARPQSVADLFHAAATAMGCDPVVVWAKARPTLVEPPRTAIEAMKIADAVFDLATEPWLYTVATGEILQAGTRMLQVRTLTRLLERFPTDEIVRRSKVARGLFEQATRIRLKSSLGTDFAVSYLGRAPVAQDGVVEGPGDWDSVGTAYCNVFPIEETAEGTIVLNGPAISTGNFKFIIEEPVRLEISKGRVVNVQGQRDAKRLLRWFDDDGDANLRRISHVGVGLDRRCGPPPKPVEMGDSESWEAMNGGTIVAFGASIGLNASGGENLAKSHLDCVVLDCDFFLNETQLIREGKFVPDGLRA